VKFCTYYSILDWHHPSQEPDWSKADEDDSVEPYASNLIKPGRKEEYTAYMKAQLAEVIVGYDPGVIWFDGGWVDWWTPADGKDLMAYLWWLKPDLIINNRAAGTLRAERTMGDYGTPEQFIPDRPGGRDFETCMTMNDTWGYKKNDDNWKSTQTLIVNLVDVVSKGGNFLLNVGPTADGRIPEASIERLREIGRWMKVNGEAIYGTRRWRVWKEGPHDVETEYEELERERRLEFTAEDIRFTSKGDVVYAALLGWPEGYIEVKSLGKAAAPDIEVTNVEMLGCDERLEWLQGDEALRVKPPAKKPCEYVYVLKVTVRRSK